jgi:hypothetical protein
VRTWGLSILVVVLAAARASADDKPWATGVSEAEQAAALALYQAGNGEFEESRYKQALVKYDEAITHWDHPAIRFNMAVAQINLERPLEAYPNLEGAMKYGAAPLGADIYAQAVTYKKLLDGQLTHLKVTCGANSDGAQVTLDGKPLLDCKGETTKLLLPGDHQIVASRVGYETKTAQLTLMPGKELVHEVQLAPTTGKTRLVRRWRARTPWLVVSAGAGAALIGGALDLLSKQKYADYDNYVIAVCKNECPPGTFDESKAPSTTTARIENVAGNTLLVVGGATIVAGLVGVYLNMPRAVAEHAPTITPTVGPSGAMTTLSWSF